MTQIGANMYFCEIRPNTYQVYKDKNDKKFYGIVKKQEYISTDMSGRKRISKCFWEADSTVGGWRLVAKKQFPTQEAAGKFLLKEAKTPYATRKAIWKPKVGV